MAPAARLVVVPDGAAVAPADTAAADPALTPSRAAAASLAPAALRLAGAQLRLCAPLLLLLGAAQAVAQLLVAPQARVGGAIGAAVQLAAGAAAAVAAWRWPQAWAELGEASLLAAALALALLCALPLWLNAPAALPWLLPVALAALVALAAALAPHGRAALLVALGAPLAGVPLGPWAVLGGGAAMLIATLAARVLRRHWQQQSVQALQLRGRLAELQAERDAALRNDRDKSRFLAIASHDLRQPVHALGLFAATLHKRLADSPEQALARNLLRSVDGLERSFNAMLDISRLDGGAVAPRPLTFPLRDVFRRLHMQYGGQAELAGLALRFSPGGKSVTSDPQLLERIVGNLVQNAIRYTTQGGVVVVARSTATHTNVEVWDSGSGIAAADLPRIFDEFFQIGRGERDRSQGLGMGLAIVKRLVALLGHSLEVSSVPGRGTMFRLGVRRDTLELGEEAAAADTQPMAPLIDAAPMVLVVDDEEPIREGLRQLLQEWGYQVMTAADAAQAESAVVALEGRVDVILSDLHLGHGAGGREVVANVRRLCAREVPAVLVTGDTAGQALRDVAGGADPVLFKPVQPRHLLAALRNVVDGGGPRA